LNPGAVVASLHDLLRRTLPESINIVARAADTGSISVDPRQLENALLNLVVNCRDAMPDGGILTIETEDAVIDAAYAASHQDVEPGDYVALSVSDNGEGIDAKILGRVFEPFFTTKEVGKGSGMGLSMVMGFVHQSHGHVTISSEPDVGTTVILYFPRVDTHQRSEQSKTTKGQPTVGASESW
jgi:signal transduction histidine kinase